MKKKAIVIGAGIGGLAIAIRLAARGMEVDVFEANNYPGGKLTEFNIGDFRFDAGPSLFTMPELVTELFSLSGVDPVSHFKDKKLDDICHYFYEDGTQLTARADVDAFASEIESKTKTKAKEVLHHLKNSHFIYNVTAHLFLEKSLHKLKSYLSLKTIWSFLQLPFLNIFSSMHSVNEKKLKDPRLVQLFDRYATYNGSDPYRAPGILNIIPHLEYNKGAFFPKGGMHHITESLFGLAKQKSVKFHFNSKVEKILIRNGIATGVKIGSNEFLADHIICNMDVVPAYRYLMPDQKHAEKTLNQERSSSALIFYWGINKSFDQLGLHNIFFSKNYQEEFEHIFEDQNICNDPTVYVNISCKESAKDAPDGMENWFVMINVPGDKGQNWDELIKYSRLNIINKLNRILKTDVAALIIEEEILEPRTIESKTGSFQGSLYGTASNNRMAAFFRHPNFSKRIDSLYFCGGSVHPGGGIPLALSSAKIVDSLIK